ncbi:MAG: 7-cyano-7-deazaguanine synthase [Vicinamibacterales bacterium]
MASRPASVVLVSSGLDSAVLLAHELAGYDVRPVYVRSGLAWEAAELRMLSRLVASPLLNAARPLTVVDLPMQDVYPADHWAITGQPPAYDTPDEDVYLVGRNLTLLAKAGIVAARADARRIVLGPLAGNPFPDATPAFFGAMAEALSRGLAHPLSIATPFAALQKSQVIELGARLGVPLELTLSCMNPRQDQHCGLCSKCRERRDAFAEAGVVDPTPYAHPSPR